MYLQNKIVKVIFLRNLYIKDSLISKIQYVLVIHL